MPLLRPHPDLLSYLPLLACLCMLGGCSDPTPSVDPAAGNGETGRAPSAPGRGGLADVLAEAEESRSERAEAVRADRMIERPARPDRLLFLGLEAPISPRWQWQPPRAVGQLADFVVPSRDSGEPAQLVIWDPGRSREVVVEHTVPDWAKQFRKGVLPQPPRLSHRDVAGRKVTIAEFDGDFRGMGGGWHRQDWAQVSAVFDGPECAVVIRLHGPRETVEMHREAFDRMVEGLRETPPS